MEGCDGEGEGGLQELCTFTLIVFEISMQNKST